MFEGNQGIIIVPGQFRLLHLRPVSEKEANVYSDQGNNIRIIQVAESLTGQRINSSHPSSVTYIQLL